MKLKKDIQFKELKRFGFKEDENNVEEGDTYYSTNNWYYEFDKESRLVVNVHDREFSVLTLSKDELCGVYDLSKITELFNEGFID